MQEEGQGKAKLFREKSLEAIESPESLNDYLRVTSPRVWLVLAAVIALLAGGILWGIFGNISVRSNVAVVSSGGETACYVPIGSMDQMKQILDQKEITVDGKACAIVLPESGEVAFGFLKELVSDQMISKACIVGGMTPESTVVRLPLEAGTGEDGVTTGVMVTETLHPISLLLK